LFSIDSAGFYCKYLAFPDSASHFANSISACDQTGDKQRFFAAYDQMNRSQLTAVAMQLLTLHALYAAQGLNNGRVSVRPSVCLSRRSTAAAMCGQNMKVSYYRNYCIDFNQILHNNRDH